MNFDFGFGFGRVGLFFPHDMIPIFHLVQLQQPLDLDIDMVSWVRDRIYM